MASDPAPNESLAAIWKEVVEECKHILEDSEADYDLIMSFESSAQMDDHLKLVQEKYRQSMTARLLRRASSHFPQFHAFSAYILLELGGQHLSAACFLGAIVLLLEVASQSEQALNEIFRHLGNLSAQFKLFEEYRKSITLDSDTLQSFFDVLVELTLCTTRAIRLFRRSNIDKFLEFTTWGKVDNLFKENHRAFAEKLDQLRELTEARSASKLFPRSEAEIIHQLDQFKLRISEISSVSSCSTIPYQRNDSFHGRNEVLEEINKAYPGQHCFSNIHTVAIWGTGGIGKTQVALEYAHQRWNGGTSVILWIASETEAEVARSFSEAAQKLKLIGDSEANTPDKNRHQVLQWLQTTVFDNVEDARVLKANRPNVGQGDILITCRSELLAESLTTSVIEISSFTIAESTALILQILNKSVVSIEEIEATRILSKQLGGLPLAIDIIAKNIRSARRFRSVVEFLPYYEQNRHILYKRAKRDIRDIAYSKDLETVWQASFQNLDPTENEHANPDAARLMQLMCFLAPEAIPQWLLQTEVTDSPKEWEFLRHDDRFEAAKLELLDLSLIKINADTGLISLHRLIQKAYFDQIAPDFRASAFLMTFTLMRKVFPTREGETHLYKRWAICEQFHQHIKALHDVYLSSKIEYLPSLSTQYQSLICDDAWYMLETQQFLAAEWMLSSILSDYDTKSIEYALIKRDLMGIFERTGRSNRAVECAEIEFKILREVIPSGDNDLANAYSDMGYSLCSAFRPLEALPYLETAISIAKQHPERDIHTKFNIDRFLRNRGRTNYQLKRYDEALADFQEAENYQAKIHGVKSHYDGETKHERAKIAAWLGNLDDAVLLNQEAASLMSKGKPNHSSVSASLYRQGWVFMQQGKLDDALLQFDKALAMCQLNESQRGNAGESARLLWRIAQIYETKGQIEDAKTFMDAAEETKRSLHGTGDYGLGASLEDSWDSLLGLLYR